MNLKQIFIDKHYKTIYGPVRSEYSSSTVCCIFFGSVSARFSFPTTVGAYATEYFCFTVDGDIFVIETYH